MPPEEMFAITAVALAPMACISALEGLRMERHGTAQLFGRWPVTRTRFRFMAGSAGDLLAPIVERRCIRIMMQLRLVSGCVLLVSPWLPALLLPALLGLVLSQGLSLLRAPYGTDGADQMVHLIAVALLLAVVDGTTRGQAAALWFIAGQSVLSYAVSGLAKASSADWRSGAALRGVLRTRLYGDAWMSGLLLKHPTTAIVMSWSVIIVQMSAPFWLLAGSYGALGYIIVFMAFHVMTMVLMGLPFFVLSFPVAYPAVVYAATNL